MIITCPECATEFKTPDSVFANGPRKLRCAKCSHVWIEEPPAPERDAPLEMPDAEVPAPDADADPEAELDDAAEFDAAEFDAAEFDTVMSAGEADGETDGEQDGDSAAEVEWAEDEQSAEARDGADEDPDGADEEDVDGGDGAAEPLHDIESLAADLPEPGDEKSGFRPNIRKWGAALAAVLALTLMGYGGYVFRLGVSQFFPPAAGLYAMLGAPVNLTGFEFEDVGIGRSFDNGFPVLSVKGKLINVSDRPRSIPDIRLALRSPDKQEVYHWTIKVKRAPLKPREMVQFSTRLASPPSEAEDIVIRFHKKKNLKVGAL
ncbi:MAG: hypothetical protein C0605_01795 [Hyphomicrobiales bacterium]|nr:MAG: hypothetical protein C0605_01795 [Hyphomicrobiales bacterium]